MSLGRGVPGGCEPRERFVLLERQIDLAAREPVMLEVEKISLRGFRPLYVLQDQLGTHGIAEARMACGNAAEQHAPAWLVAGGAAGQRLQDERERLTGCAELAIDPSRARHGSIAESSARKLDRLGVMRKCCANAALLAAKISEFSEAQRRDLGEHGALANRIVVFRGPFQLAL